MKKLFAALLGVLIILAALWLFHVPLLDAAAQRLIVQDQLAHADGIVVLAGDGNGERVNQAVELYQKGYAPMLLMSGGPLAWHLTSADWMKKQAMAQGIPAQVILVQPKSQSTIDDARFTLPIVKAHAWKSIILVTSPAHSRRARKYFKKVYGHEGIKVISYPVQHSEFNPSGWWRRHEDTQIVIWEYVSLFYYWLKGY